MLISYKPIQPVALVHPVASVNLTIIIPFIPSQVPLLSLSLQEWNKMIPCVSEPGGSLAFFVHSQFTPTLKRAILDIWYTKVLPHVRRCFTSEPLFLQGNLPAELPYPDGPCQSFYHITEHEHVQHFQLWEPDLIPIRRYWLDELLFFSIHNENCSEFWMQGSMSRCQGFFGEIAKRRDYHLNGNSLYCMDPPFRTLLQKVQQIYPHQGCISNEKYQVGYDHVLYHHIHQNFSLKQQVGHKFRYTNMIQNRCSDPYNATQIHLLEPETYLIHSKSFFRTRIENLVVQTFHILFHRDPEEQEARKWKARLALAEIEPENLIHSICASLLPAASKKDLIILKEKGGKKINYRKKAHRNRKYRSGQTSLDTETSIEKYICPLFPNWQTHFPLSQWNNRFPQKQYLWTIDFHPAPVMCNVDLWTELNLTIHMEIDHPLCQFFGVCRDRLRILRFDQWAGVSLQNDRLPFSQLRDLFYEYYRKDPEFERVNIISVSHPASNMELFVPFVVHHGKKLLVYLTTRLEFGRHDEQIDWRVNQHFFSLTENTQRWIQLLDTIQFLYHSHRNKVAFLANNEYDAEYFYYFTGIRPPVIPSWCAGEMFSYYDYLPTEEDYLLGPSRDNLDLGNCSSYSCQPWQHPLLQSLIHTLQEKKSKIKFTRIRDHYPVIRAQDLVRHPGMVLIPYQASVMSMMEYYRLNIPFFAPSQRLLISWIQSYGLVWERVYGNPPPLLTHVLSSERDKVVFIPNPNSNQDETLWHWIPLFDIYQLPFVQYFDSWAHLIHRLEHMESSELATISHQMKMFNRKERNRIRGEWEQVFSSWT